MMLKQFAARALLVHQTQIWVRYAQSLTTATAYAADQHLLLHLHHQGAEYIKQFSYSAALADTYLYVSSRIKPLNSVFAHTAQS